MTSAAEPRVPEWLLVLWNAPAEVCALQPVWFPSVVTGQIAELEPRAAVLDWFP